MNREEFELESILAAVSRIERGTDIDALATELGCSTARLLVWLGQYGSGRIVKKVRNIERSAFVSAKNFYVSAGSMVERPGIDRKDPVVVLPARKADP